MVVTAAAAEVMVTADPVNEDGDRVVIKARTGWE